MDANTETAKKQEYTDVPHMDKENTSFEPACPYYPDPDSELVCPYFIMANRMGPAETVMGKGNWAGFASLSLILGVISICLCWLSIAIYPAFSFVIMSILAIVFGMLGMRDGKNVRNGRMSSGVGLVLGILALVFTLLSLVIGFMFWR